MQDKYKDIICTNFSLVIKHEPSHIEQILKLYIEYNWLKNFAINYDATRNIKIIFVDDLITSSNDVKIFFHDQSTVAFNSSGKVILKSFKKKKEA